MHIGTKLINAEPMTRAAYNELRGWQLPADENGADEGYLVEYLDGGKPNVEGRAGYVSWSPKDVFDAAYRPVNAMTFGLAIEALKMGKKVRRASWEHRDFFYLVLGSSFTVNRAPLLGIYPEGTEIDYQSHIDQRKHDGTCGVADINQADILAEDWQVVE